MMRRLLLPTLLSIAAASGAAWAADAPPPAVPPATYRVTLVDAAHPRLSVVADVPIDGKALTMAATRPAGIPELDARGWPALVSNLKVMDGAGGALDASADGAAGWQLSDARTGRVHLAYDVDYAALSSRGWPAPRETGLVDAEHVVLTCRSIFVTSPAVRDGVVSFELPKGWRTITPWEPNPKITNGFAVADANDLADNLVVFAKSSPDVVTAGGLRLQIVAMGPWEPARKEVRRVLNGVVPRLVGLMGTSDRENYLVVLLPVVEHGGESYRHSFAMTYEAPPSRANSAVWGNTIAHEVFHLWNGWKLQGKDYPTSQWFQEGFTEYAANLAMVGAKLIDEKQFLQKLNDHVTNYEKLQTTLEAGGEHKGPPLYAAGALVAFTWDVRLLSATDEKKGFGDFLRALWKQTNQGRAPYAWADIEAALSAVNTFNWASYYADYIKGTMHLPLKRTFGRVGVNIIMGADDIPVLGINPDAPEKEKTLWKAILAGR
jgi:predicted metalloprotease with PDZ domain